MRENRNRKRNRLQGYNYSEEGWYFVTICVQDMESYFGRIENEKMYLNEFGGIVNQQWLWLAQQYEYVILDEYIVMPNHFHGIITIDNDRDHVGTGRDLSLHDDGRDASQRGDVRKVKSLSALIGAFKTTSSKLIHKTNTPSFAWQRSFYDRIIRDEMALNNIRNYIYNNPFKWEFDRNN